MNELYIQSYCFRNIEDNKIVAKMIKDLCLDGVELCQSHVSFYDSANHDEVINIYKDTGLKIVSIGIELLADDERKERKLCEFAQKAGAKQVSVDFSIDHIPDAYRTAERIAKEYDIRYAIHNHGAPHWLGNIKSLQHVFQNTNDRIGLCLDTAWAMDSREDPIAMAEQLKDRLYAVHLKDFIFDRAGKPEDIIIGKGNLDLPEFIKTLKAINFEGPMILEYEGDPDNPIPALKECVQVVRDLQ